MLRLLVLTTTTLVLAFATGMSVAAPGSAAATAGAAPRAASMPTAGQLDAYLASKGSPMAGQGTAFIASAGRWQVDPRLLVAIAGAESSFGRITCAPFNAWGWGCPDGPYDFDSWADGIDTVMEGLRTNYLAEGRTSVATVHQKYAPLGAANDPTGLNNNWTINVSRFVVELGGDPNDIDMDGVAGSIPLGPLGGPGIESFGFSEEEGSEAGALEVAAGVPTPLVVSIRNTGQVAWETGDVRLRRVDTEPTVVGAPYGALSSSTAVAPGEAGRFAIQLSAAGSREGVVRTTWRLEGPSGLFGPEIVREVQVAVPDFVAGEASVVVEAANGGVAGGTSAWNVVVRVRNSGSGTWTRDRDDAVYLGLVDSAGDFRGEGWINDQVATRMLEREAAPGEEASFVFRVRGEVAALAVRPFRSSGWAAGGAGIVRLGSVDAAAVTALEHRVAAPEG